MKEAKERQGYEEETEPVEILVVAIGGPIVNEGYVHARGEKVVALSIDMASKYCEVGAITGGQYPGVMIDAVERSLGLNEVLRDATTFIEFPQYEGWRIWCADIGRYTLTVCLVKD